MSAENTELVRRVNAAFNSGDIERTLALMHADFETSVPPEFSAEPDVYRGHDGLRRYLASFEDAMKDIRFHQEEILEVGDSVVVDVRLTAKGRTTGIPVVQRLAQVWSFSDGKVIEVRSYSSFAEAVDAVVPAE